MHVHKLSVIGITLATIGLVIAAPSAFAHVVVTPSEVVTAGIQTFDASVPNEKNVPLTSLKLVMPAGLKDVSPTVKQGWTINLDKTGDTVNSITWSGGTIDAGLRDDFSFSAQAPEKTVDLNWKAYQTYADGTMVSWDKSSSAETDTSGPYSVTKVVNKSDSDVATDNATQTAKDVRASTDTALYVAIAAFIASIAAIVIGLRKK